MAVKNISLNEIAYSVLEAYRSRVDNTDEIDIRWIKYLVKITRSKILKQRFDKPMHTIDESLIQSLTPNGYPVELEIVDSSIHPLFTTEKYMVRTKIEIPQVIDTSKGVGAFVRIASTDRLNDTYPILPFRHAIHFGNGKFNIDDVCAFLLDNKLYLQSTNKQSINGIKYLDIRAVFQDPTYVATLNDPAHTDDDNYPVTSTLARDILEYILQTEFRITSQVPEENDDLN